MSSSTASDLGSDAEAARQELLACEKEISGIKGLLRTIGPQGDDSDETNSLTVHWIKVRRVNEYLE